MPRKYPPENTMEKVVDRRLVEASRLRSLQKESTSTAEMINLQEARQKLVSDVENDLSPIMALVGPWKYLPPTLS